MIMKEVIRLTLGPFRTNCYLLKEDGHILIVDPAARMERILVAIDDNERVDGILLTHGHFDHIGAVDKLQAHFTCPVYMNLFDEKLVRDAQLNSMGEYSHSLHCPIQNLYEPHMKIGIFDLTIFYAPGHTAGSVLILWENHLFTGDVLFKNAIGRTDLYSGSHSCMRRSLQMIRELNADYHVYPGHDETTNLLQELRMNPYLK